MKKLITLLCLATAMTYGQDHCRTSQWTTPSYCGGFYADATWLYLKSCQTDGDFQTGTFLTLTETPPTLGNLHAVVQQAEPDYKSAFRGTLGYYVPCSNMDLSLSYFYYDPDGSTSLSRDGIIEADGFEFFQSFLGGAWAEMDGSIKEEIQQGDLLAGWQFHINKCFSFHPFAGVTFAKVRRDLNVSYLNEVLDIEDPNANVVSYQNSDYAGAGPVVGADFSYKLFSCLQLDARIGGGLLLGQIESVTDSTSLLEDIPGAFYTHQKYLRAVPMMNARLGITLQPECSFCNMGFALRAGYETDYYFKAVDRYNPDNGYIINDEPYPVRFSSNVSLSGPYVELSIFNTNTRKEEPCLCEPHFDDIFCGFYGEVKNLWLKPLANNDDLVYATLSKPGGVVENVKNDLDYHWAGLAKLGYRNCDDVDVSISYFHFDHDGYDVVEAGITEEIFSIDASGNPSVAYEEASSRVEYQLNQIDLQAGKCFSYCGKAKLLLSGGVRFAQLERTRYDSYDGGEPATNFEQKNNKLESRYSGAGPFVRFDPSYQICDSLQLTGFASFSFLVGEMRSTLDQVSVGTDTSTSNTLRFPYTCWVVPVIDLGAGVSFSCDVGCGTLIVEAGYQFSDYFRSVNQIYPVFLTGLNQYSSDFRLHGPYVTVKLANF